MSPGSRIGEDTDDQVRGSRRWRQFLARPFTRGGLVRFHTAEKFLLLAHSPDRYRELGRIVARVKELGERGAIERYERSYRAALAEPATRGKHTNVLLHLLGFLTTRLSRESRQELARLIEDYRQGLVPLIAPVTLMRNHARDTGQEYLLQQVYLDPSSNTPKIPNRT